MKLYYYVVISVGILLTLNIAGVSGIGNQVVNTFINNETMVQPSTQYNGSVSNSPIEVGNQIKSSNTGLWSKFLIALLAMLVVGAIKGVQVAGLGASIDGRKAVLGAVAYGLFGIFVSDMWTFITFVFGLGVDWISWFLGVIITVYTIGFAIACLEFTGGTD